MQYGYTAILNEIFGAKAPFLFSTLIKKKGKPLFETFPLYFLITDNY